MAAELGLTQQHLSQLETGRRVLSMGLRRRMVHELGVPAEELGLASGDDRPWVAQAPAPEVVASQLAWREQRRWLNRHRADLSRLAVRFYPQEWQVAASGLIAGPGWRIERPVDLSSLGLRLDDCQRAALIDGTEPQTEGVRPLRTVEHRFGTYTAAMRQLARPSLFESRPSYRLTGIGPGAHRLSFSLANYFDKLDVCEAVGHELASATLSLNHIPTTVDRIRLGATGSSTPIRDLIEDPFDLIRRSVIPAVVTLTIRLRRHPHESTFLVHWRDPAKVAENGGVYHVIPAGEFQPSSVNPWDRRTDFDVWRNIVREYSEELLGTPEHDGTRSQPIDYESWPFHQQMQAARGRGTLQVFLLGMALDALTLAATILTVVVIDDDEFQAIFGDAVSLNEEGEIMNPGGGRALDGVPFTETAVQRLLTTGPMASPGAGCLSLAWQHRRQLLGL